MCGWNSKAQTLCASDMVIFMGDDGSLVHPVVQHFIYLIIAIHPHLKKIDFRADSIAYILFFSLFFYCLYLILWISFYHFRADK